MKKGLKILLLVTIILTIGLTAAACNKDKGPVATEGLEYRLILNDYFERDFYTVSSAGTAANSGEIFIPSTYDGLKVVGIDANAFAGMDGITKVIIAEGVEFIDETAFYGCSSLTEVVLPNSLESIGSLAFYGCDKLTTVVVPKNVSYIGSGVFMDCNSLENLTLSVLSDYLGKYFGAPSYDTSDLYVPSTLRNVTITSATSVSANAFIGLKNIKEVTLGNSVSSIGSSAFANCDGLTTVNIPSSLTSIGNSAFSECKSLTSFTLGKYVSSIGDNVFYNCESLTTITLNQNLTSIGSYAFSGCIKLGGITLPSNLKSIGSYAFSEVKFQSLVIPESVTSIGSGILSGNNVIHTLTVPFIGSGKDSSNSTLNYLFGSNYYDENSNEISVALSELSVTNGQYIASSAFNFWGKNLKKLNLGSNTSSISISALNYLTELEGVYVNSANVDYATVSGILYNGAKTTMYFVPKQIVGEITIPYGVATVGSSAFNGCSKITKISFPSTVDYISTDAFVGCIGITSYYVDSTNNYYYTSSVGALYTKRTYFPYGYDTLISYPKITAENAEIESSILYVSAYAFENCDITNISLPTGLIEVGSYAFLNSTLSTLVIPSTVTSMGSKLLLNNETITSLSVPFVGISAYPFIGFFFGFENSYDNYRIPSTLKTVSVTGSTSIQSDAFNDANYIETVNISGTQSYIYASAFANMDSLTKLAITSQNIYSISNNMLTGSNSIKNLSVPFVGNTSSSSNYLSYFFGGSSYSNNEYGVPSSLSNVTVSNSYNIQSYTFYGCNYVKEVSISGSYGYNISIGAYAFANSGINRITLSNNISSIGNYAFSNLALTTLVIPNSVTTFGTSILSGVNSLTTLTVPTVSSTLGTYFGVSNDALPYTLKNVTISSRANIPASAFANCSYLENVIIANSTSNSYDVTIGNYAFQNCTSLISVSLASNISNIGNYAFDNCYSLTTINLPTNLTTLGNYAFQNCTSINNLVINETLYSLGNGVFTGWTPTQTIDISNNIYYASWNVSWNGGNATCIEP